MSLAALDSEVAARCWTVHGFSKNYGLAGLRVGYVHAPSAAACERLLQASLASTTMSGVATLSQIAAVAALEEGGDLAGGLAGAPAAPAGSGRGGAGHHARSGGAAP